MTPAGALLLWLAACQPTAPEPRLSLEAPAGFSAQGGLLQASLTGGEAAGWAWTVDGVEGPYRTESGPEGAILQWTGPVAVGAHRVEVVAQLPGARLSASLELEVAAGAAPQVSLSAPALLAPGAPLLLVVTATDSDGAPEALGLSWSASGGSGLETGDLPASGAARFALVLWPEADGTLDLTATDTEGNTASTSVTWSFIADIDQDGWDAETDCDDADGAVHPEAAEVCDGIDNDCDGAADVNAIDAAIRFVDSDGDGQGDAALPILDCGGVGVPEDGDCDDGAPEVYPGAPETCDGVDEDCDGDIDEETGELILWYRDDDGDGYGGSLSVSACAQPPGYTAAPSDCDDLDRSAWPGATEYCDGADDDCDWVIDEPEAVDAPVWFADGDGDGFGDAAAGAPACLMPTGYVADNTDCYDVSPAVYPGAPESCNRADDDCDGATDEPDAVDAPVWYADADGDGRGDGAAPAVSCDAPPGHVADAADCDDTDASVSPDALEFCDGRDDDCDGAADEPEAEDAQTFHGDSDGDGFGDPAAARRACAQPAAHVTDASDCDDADASVSPVATERCDGIDNDCDGLTDDPGAADAALWYADADGDGFGDAATTARACARPAGYGTDAADCDDRAPEVSPAALESCNNLDDDCDGTTDEADATDALTFWLDGDGDGWGTTALTACAQPAGYAAEGGDCDDSRDRLHPWDSDEDGSADRCGWRAMAAGGQLSCGLDSDGIWICQGATDYDSDIIDPFVETGISIGDLFGCGLDEALEIRCWGAVPALPPGGAFTAISAGWTHACGLATGGSAACWGEDTDGQSSPPSDVFVEIATGYLYSCAIDTGGTVQCWGAPVSAASPPQGSFTRLAAGYAHACALDSAGALLCWGDDTAGETSAPSGGFLTVSAGEGFSCGLQTDGTIRCWGTDAGGESSPPGGVFVEMQTGQRHGCGLTAAGEIRCWGSGPAAAGP